MSGFGNSFVTSEDLFIEETVNDTFNKNLLEDHDVNNEINPKMDLNEPPEALNMVQTIPSGWVINGSGSNMSIISPSGKRFQSRRQALTNMINSGNSSLSEILLMRSTLVHEGWITNESFPTGWFMKLQK